MIYSFGQYLRLQKAEATYNNLDLPGYNEYSKV